MSVTIVPQVTALSAGHPLVAIIAKTLQPNSGDAAGAAAAASAGIEVAAGSPAASAANGVLTVAGVAAVLSTLSTYYGGLSSTQKAQIGQILVDMSPTGVRCIVQQSSVASFVSTLATVLNNTSNYGPAGT